MLQMLCSMYSTLCTNYKYEYIIILYLHCVMLCYVDIPRFNKRQYTASVYENASVGSEILKVDAYSANYLVVNYEIEFAERNVDHPFTLNRTTGVLLVSKPIDPGQFTSDQFLEVYQLTVIATLDGYNTNRTCLGHNQGIDCTTITVNVVDINEFSPMFSSQLYFANVSSLAIPNNPLFNKITFDDYSLQLTATDKDKKSIVSLHLLDYTCYFFINETSGAITVISPLTSLVGQFLNLTVKAVDQDGKDGNTVVSVYIFDECSAIQKRVRSILDGFYCSFYSQFSSGMAYNAELVVNATQWIFNVPPRVYYDTLKISLFMTNIILHHGNRTGWIDVYFLQSQDRQSYAGQHLLQLAQLTDDFVYWNIISPLFVPLGGAAILLNITISVDGLTTLVQPRTSDDFSEEKPDPMYLVGNRVPTGCGLSRQCKDSLILFKQQERLAAAFGQRCVYNPLLFKTHLVDEVYRLAEDCVNVENISEYIWCSSNVYILMFAFLVYGLFLLSNDMMQLLSEIMFFHNHLCLPVMSYHYHYQKL